MSSARGLPLSILILAMAGSVLLLARPVEAMRIYPANKCVSTKQSEAAQYCRSALRAWARWDRTGDAAARDAALTDAAARMSTRWGRADNKSAEAGTDCSETTTSAASAQAQMDAAIADIVASINDGLDLGDRKDARCGNKLLIAAARKCLRILNSESRYIRRLDRDTDETGLALRKTIAEGAFNKSFASQIARGCPTNGTAAGVGDLVHAVADELVLSTIVSPHVDPNQYMTISPTGVTRYQKKDLAPKCVFGTPYHFFAKRGSVNKLVMYYQGGGACWEQLTCGIPVCDSSSSPAENPSGFGSGFGDLSNPDNPFKDWHAVFVSYCSCDVHFGDEAQSYTNTNPASPVDVEHRGFDNAKIAEKWAREHFVNPEEIFVTGSSAGAYGALFHGGLLHEVYPASQIHVLADAGNGVITTDFLQNEFNNWGFEKNLPPDIPGVIDSITTGTGIPGYMEAVTNFFPNTNWAHYTTAFDGGAGGQTGFYNLMLNGNNPIAALTWWEGSCAFNSVMRQQAFDTVPLAPGNYRYYIGSGSRHTMWGGDKVYSDTTGGVPTITNWINAMLSSKPGAPDPNWTNVEASPFNVVLPGDPTPPVIPTPPFAMSGPDVVINCP